MAVSLNSIKTHKIAHTLIDFSPLNIREILLGKLGKMSTTKKTPYLTILKKVIRRKKNVTPGSTRFFSLGPCPMLPPKVCRHVFRGFCTILLTQTNQPTHRQGWTHNLIGGGRLTFVLNSSFEVRKTGRGVVTDSWLAEWVCQLDLNPAAPLQTLAPKMMSPAQDGSPSVLGCFGLTFGQWRPLPPITLNLRVMGKIKHHTSTSQSTPCPVTEDKLKPYWDAQQEKWIHKHLPSVVIRLEAWWGWFSVPTGIRTGILLDYIQTHDHTTNMGYACFLPGMYR